jgi:cell fate regulator YaaT (PSP1 superfamily)
VSVSTSAARFQDISLNPQKLAGQCAKLKCCLNYEVDAYVEASRGLPNRDIELETQDGTYYFFKCDIMRGEITYSTDKHIPANLVTITGRRAFAIIEMNKRGERPETLQADGQREVKRSADLLEQENINRFDNMQRGGKKRRKGGGRPEQRKGNDRREKGSKNNPPKSE